MINKHKSNKIKENSNTVRHLNNGTDHRHSKSCCDQSSPARRTMTEHWDPSPSNGRQNSMPQFVRYITNYGNKLNLAQCVSEMNSNCISRFAIPHGNGYITITLQHWWCWDHYSGTLLLNHQDRMTYIRASKIDCHWFRKWLVTCSVII